MNISLPSWNARTKGATSNDQIEVNLSGMALDVFFQASTAILCLAGDGRPLWANPKMLELLGCAENEFPLRAQLTAGQAPSAFDLFCDCLMSKMDSAECEASLTRSDGSVRQVVASLMTVPDNQGQLCRIYFIRPKDKEGSTAGGAEQGLKSPVLDILDQTGALVVASDQDGRIVHWSEQSRRATGLDLETVCEMDLVPHDLFAAEASQKIEFEAKAQYETVAYRKPDGQKVFVQWRLLEKVPVDAWAACAVGRDVTDLEWTQRQQDVLARVLSILGPASTLEEGLRETLAALCQAADFQLAEMWKVDGGDGVMTPWVFWHAGGEDFDEFVRGSKDYTFAPGVGLPGRAWQSGRAEWMVDLPNDYDSYFVRTDLAREAGIRSIFCVPLTVDHEVVAAFLFHSTQMMPVDPGIANMIEAVCRQIADTIQRRKAEASAAEIAERYRLISETTTDLVYSYSFEKSGALKLDWYAGGSDNGLNPSILSDWTGPEGCWAGLIIDEDQPEYLRRVRRLLSGEKSVDELRIVDGTDGQIKWVRLTGIPVMDGATGQIQRIVGSATDITDEKVTKEQLRNREKKLETIGREAVCAQTISWHLWHSGRSISEGLSAVPEVLRNGMQDPNRISVSIEVGGAEWHTPGFAKTPWSIIASIICHGKTVGSIHVAHHGAESDPFLDEERDLIEEVARRIGIAYSFMQNHRELAASERRYKAVVDAQSELIARFTPAGKCLFANSAMQRFFEIQSESLSEKNFIHLVAGDQVDRFNELMDQIDGLSSDFTLISAVKRNNEKARYISWVMTGIFSHSGDLMEIQAVGRDITEQKLAEQEVIESRRRERLQERRLARVQRAVLAQELAAGFAHQINQPLGSVAAQIGTCLQLVNQRYPDDMDTISAVERGLAQVEATGLKVKEFSRMLSSSASGSERDFLDLQDLVHCVIDLMEGFLCANEIKVEFVPEAGPYRIKGAALEIEQVILNMMTNAVEAMAGLSDRCLVLKLSRKNSMVRFSIADLGPHMSERDYDHMFEWFTSSKKDGLGMGLAISKSIIERHGGRIEVRPNRPRGSVFTIVLPEVQSDASQRLGK